MANSEEGCLVGEACWRAFRGQMPVAERWAYLDHAAVGPLAGPARAAIAEWSEEAARDGDVCWPSWNEKIGRTRALAAQLVRAEVDEIALVGNTTQGIQIVAEGYPWRSGDNVVTLADEFPTNQYPWLNLAWRGVETRRVATEEGRVDLDRLDAACDRWTRIVAISWVSFSSGWRNELGRVAEIAHRHGALLMVDAIQGLGVFELDVHGAGVDFLSADGHKWLLGPEGAGVFFIRREHLDRLRPVGIGWHSVVGAHEFSRIELTLKPTAERYEGGSHNVPGMIALGASLELLGRFGSQAIGGRVLELTDEACERLARMGAVVKSDRSAEHKSGLVIFELPGRDPKAMVERCRERGVVLSSRAGRLRISPHAYNDQTDLERLIEAMA